MDENDLPTATPRMFMRRLDEGGNPTGEKIDLASANIQFANAGLDYDIAEFDRQVEYDTSPLLKASTETHTFDFKTDEQTLGLLYGGSQSPLDAAIQRRLERKDRTITILGEEIEFTEEQVARVLALTDEQRVELVNVLKEKIRKRQRESLERQEELLASQERKHPYRPTIITRYDPAIYEAECNLCEWTAGSPNPQALHRFIEGHGRRHDAP